MPLLDQLEERLKKLNNVKFEVDIFGVPTGQVVVQIADIEASFCGECGRTVKL